MTVESAVIVVAKIGTLWTVAKEILETKPQADRFLGTNRLLSVVTVRG
jgi:hypothetical protein